MTVRATDVEHIAAVKVTYPVEPAFSDAPALTLFDHYDDIAYDEEEQLYRISMFYAQDLLSIPGQGQGCPDQSDFRDPYAVVEVTAGGPDWPDWRDASLNDIARPDTFTNVQGGHGFVGGIYSDTIRVPIRRRE